MKLVGVARQVSAEAGSEPGDRVEVIGKAESYVECYQLVMGQVPDGWQLLHVRRTG